MYNIILDKLPTEYKGYLIRSSFRIGLQICMCMQDSNLTENEQLKISLDLLYGKGIPPDPKVAVDGLAWFLSGGYPDKKTYTQESKPLFYWDFDNSRIYSSFRKSYGIDLAKTDMHFFEFLSLIGSLDKDSAFNKAVEIRGYDTKGLSGKALHDIQNMRRDLTPETEYSDEELKQIELFNALLDGGDVNG